MHDNGHHDTAAAPAGGAPARRRAYIGSFTSAGGRGVTTAAVDPVSGALTVLGSTDAVPDPSYLALAPDRAVLYAVGELPRDGLAAAFSLADPDAPAPLGRPAPAGGDAPTHLCLAGGRLLTANYGSGSVSSLPLGPDGAPGGPALVLRHAGHGPDPARQAAPHAHAVLPAPGGRLLTTDLGTDTLRVCDLDPDGAPRVHAETRLRPGSGPRHLVFHPRGDLVYVVNELAATLAVLRWDAAAGALEPVGEWDAGGLPDGAAGASAGSVANYPSAAVVSPDGRFLWVANRGHDSVAVFALGAGDGVPEARGAVPCGGHWPRDLALDPAGGRLYAANERSGDVTWFDVDPATGMPRRAGAVPVPAATCVVFA